MRAIVAVLGLVLTAALGGGAARAAESSCVSCHRGLAGKAALAHDFKDWETSAHGKAAVSCESCHGGNPMAAGRDQAHAGVLRSTEKKSPLYFTAIPATCGACHAPEFDAFKASAHFKELRRDGRGPNCVTCHGAMANHVIAPRDMEMTCTLCHRDPTKAYGARMALDSAGVLLKRLEAGAAKAKPGAAEASLAETRKLLAQARVQWHTFDMAKVIETTAAAKRAASDGLKALGEPAAAPAKKR